VSKLAGFWKNKIIKRIIILFELTLSALLNATVFGFLLLTYGSHDFDFFQEIIQDTLLSQGISSEIANAELGWHPLDNAIVLTISGAKLQKDDIFASIGKDEPLRLSLVYNNAGIIKLNLAGSKAYIAHIKGENQYIAIDNFTFTQATGFANIIAYMGDEAMIPMRLDYARRNGEQHIYDITLVNSDVAYSRLLGVISSFNGEGYYNHETANGEFTIDAIETALFGDTSIKIIKSGDTISISSIIPLIAHSLLMENWPENLASNARKWIKQNLSQGIIKNITLRLKIDDLSKIADYLVSFDLENYRLQTIDKIPTPLTNVNAKAKISDDKININIISGLITPDDGETVYVQEPTTLLFSQLNDDVQYLDIDLKLTGKTTAFIKTLQASRWQNLVTILDKITIDNQQGSDVKASLNMRLPLLNAVEMADITTDVQAMVANYGASFALSDDYLLALKPANQQDKLLVKLDSQKISLLADVIVDDNYATAKVKLSQPIVANDTGMEIDASGTLALKQLTDNRINATVPFQASILQKGDNTSFNISTKPTNVHVEALKPFYWQGNLTKQRLVINAIGSIKKNSSKVNIDAAIGNETLDIDIANHITIAKFNVGDNIGHLQISPHGIAIDAKSLSFTNIADIIDALATSGANSTQTTKLTSFDDNKDQKIITATITSVYLNNGANKISNVAINTYDDYLKLTANSDESTLSLRYDRNKGYLDNGQKRKLTAKATNVGNFLDQLGLYSKMRGGELTLIGDLTINNDIENGEVKVEDFSLVEAPVLARLLGVASLTSILDLLRSDGLHFSKLFIPFNYVQGVILTPDAKMAGASIGISTQGYIDINSEHLDMTGSFMPLNTINNAIEAIPLIGDILTWGGNESIIAMDYAVRGKFDNLNITVNPLSTLTPGFLRGIFDVF
jgi:hypothetical protein